MYWNLVHVISDSCNSAWVDISILINPVLQMTTQRLREITFPQVMILRGWRCCHNDCRLITPISQRRTLRPREVTVLWARPSVIMVTSSMSGGSVVSDSWQPHGL